MTPIGPVAAGGDSVEEHVNRRSYPFTLLPAQKRQTFTTPAIALVPPFTRFGTAATVESGKIYEASIEQIDLANSLLTPIGPGGTKATNYLTSFDCIMGATVGVPGNIDNTAFMAIEIYSQDLDTLVDNPTNGCVQLKWQLKDPTQWMLSVYPGLGIAGRHFSFSIPSSQAAGGHKTRLLWDPYGLVASAYVDDVLKAKVSIAGMSIVPDGVWSLSNGILIWNGNITAAPAIKAYWSGAVISTYGMHNTGAGAF